MPCLMNLAATVVLMAAKVEQPLSPNFNRLIRLIKKDWKITIDKQDILDMEERILREL